jgi:hypothetical protein
MSSDTRILFVADLNVYSKGLGRARILAEMPVRATTLTHTALGGEKEGHPRFSLAYRIAHRLGRVLDTEGANRALVRHAGTLRPDLIWVEKGTMIRPQALQAVRRAAPNARLASYSEDDMALAHNRTRDYANGLWLYDTVFTTKAANLEPGELAGLGAKRVVLVDKAYDPHQHKPVPVGEEDVRALGGDVGFVGTFEAERARSLMHLAENGIFVRVWGNGWGHLVGAHPNLAVENRAVVNTEGDLAYTRTICATRINLAFLRKLNRDSQTDRSVEIPACGGFMLAERSADHARLFIEDREAAFFASNDELLDKVTYYLAHEAERAAIARAGRDRVRRDGHDEKTRLKAMLETALERPLPA